LIDNESKEATCLVRLNGKMMQTGTDSSSGSFEPGCAEQQFIRVICTNYHYLL